MDRSAGRFAAKRTGIEPHGLGRGTRWSSSAVRTRTTSHWRRPRKWIGLFSRSDRDTVPPCPPSRAEWDLVRVRVRVRVRVQAGHAGPGSIAGKARICSEENGDGAVIRAGPAQNPPLNASDGSKGFVPLSAAQNPLPIGNARSGGFRADPRARALTCAPIPSPSLQRSAQTTPSSTRPAPASLGRPGQPS